MKTALKLFLLSTVVTTLCLAHFTAHAQKPAATTADEYNYMTTAYWTDAKAGKLKPGYEAGEKVPYTISKFTFMYIPLIRVATGQKLLIGYEVDVVSEGKNVHFSIPIGNNSLIDKFYDSLDTDKDIVRAFFYSYIRLSQR